MKTEATTTIELAPDQMAQMQRLKAYFPYRIVWGMFDKITGEFSCSANSDKRRMNQAIRAGHTVFSF